MTSADPPDDPDKKDARKFGGDRAKEKTRLRDVTPRTAERQDAWIIGYFIALRLWLRLTGRRHCRRFFQQAKAEYRWFRETGGPGFRRRAWRAIQRCAECLKGER